VARALPLQQRPVEDSYDRPRRGVDRRGMTVISSGHALADCCQGAVPALLPYLIAARGWSYATASALVLAATLSSSVVQPGCSASGRTAGHCRG
jgi:uncharacterized membrane protein (DUF4010 family)